VIAKIKKAQKFKAATRIKKWALNQGDRRWWIKQAVLACNSYIKLRDAEKPCICCPEVFQAVQWDAGHYIAAGSNSTLRFNEFNIHKQRGRPCNADLSGNLVHYRMNLIKRIGLEKVEWLESQPKKKSWTIDELKEVVAYYKNKTSELKRLGR